MYNCRLELKSKMVGAVFVDKYQGLKDIFGQQVGDWAVQATPGHANCKYCVDTVINFKAGKQKLLDHSQTKKHQDNVKKNEKNKTQPSIVDVFAADAEMLAERKKKQELEDKTQELEIAITLLLARHSVPSTVVDCIMSTLKEKVTDSQIIANVKLGREKARYLTEHGLGEYFEEETIKKLRSCDAFGVAMDESEVNKQSELEVICIIINHPSSCGNGLTEVCFIVKRSNSCTPLKEDYLLLRFSNGC